MIFMPELAEVRIMSDYINTHSINREFNSIQHIDKNNTEVIPLDVFDKFSLLADTNGKEMILNLQSGSQLKKVSVFMGMNGSWKFVSTKDWEQSKYIRLKIDSSDGHSFILYGGYMGPKYSLTGFNSKRGPDPTKEFDKFKQNILDNLDKKTFDKPICESLLDQKYFNGIGNYLRSTILYYIDTDPFMTGREAINSYPEILNMCRDIPLKSYNLKGGQLRDWQNPFGGDRSEFMDWVYYQKGSYCKDKGNRTFWFNPKWNDSCPYKYKTKSNG